MNRNQLAILLVLVLVVGGGGLFLRKRQDASWQGTNPAIGKKLLAGLPVNDIAHLSLKQGSDEVNLEKKDDLWRVRERDGYPANFSEITDFLLKVKDLKIAQSEKVGASQLPRLALVPGSGTNAALVVDFRDKADKSLQTLTLGKMHMKKSDRPSPFGEMGGEEGWPDGRYVKVGSDSENVSLIPDSLANIKPKPEQWLSKDFFKIEKVRSVSVDFPAATNSWKLSRETENGEWKLADAKPTEQLDAGKASGATGSMGSPNFVDVAPAAKADSFGLDKPTVAKLETFEDFSYTLKIGPKTNENYPVLVMVEAQIAKERPPGKDEKPEDKIKLDKEFKDKQTKVEEKLVQEKSLEKWTYLVAAWPIDSLLKERGQLLAEKKEEPKTDAPKSEGAAAIPNPPIPGDELSTTNTTPPAAEPK